MISRYHYVTVNHYTAVDKSTLQVLNVLIIIALISETVLGTLQTKRIYFKRERTNEYLVSGQIIGACCTE